MSDKSAIIKSAKRFYERKFIESGYIAVREGDGILINSTGSNLAELKEDDLVFVNDKNIDSFEGNFRAAAVILFCAIRQNKTAEAAAIVDSDSILKFSSKRRTLRPILDDLAQLCGSFRKMRVEKRGGGNRYVSVGSTRSVLYARRGRAGESAQSR